MPIHKGQSGERGPDGKANVTVTKDKVIVKYIEGDEAGNTITLFPEDVKIDIKSGTYFVRMNSDMTQIWGLRPGKGGQYVAQFKEFAKDENGVVRVSAVDERSGVKNGRAWKIPAHLEFTVLLTITSQGEYQGLTIPMNMTYCFSEYEDTGEAMISGSGMTKVLSFLEAAGVDFESDSIPMNAPPKLLSHVEALLLSKDTMFAVKLSNKGWVEETTSLPADMVRMFRSQSKEETKQEVAQETEEVKPPQYSTINDIPPAVLMQVGKYAEGKGLDANSLTVEEVVNLANEMAQ